MTPLSPQDSLQLARFALDHADDAAFWTDADGRILYVNEATGKALDATSQDLLSLNLADFSPELTPELWSQLRKEIQTHDRFAFELTLRSRAGRVFDVEMTLHQMHLTNRAMLCGFFRDVNEKKRLEQLKNEFVSTVSHELRTPMTIIRESVSQVLDGLMGEVPHAQREALYVTLSGIDRLARIINDLLDVSRLEAGKSALRWERLNLVELVREVIQTFAGRARERGLELAFTPPSHDVIFYADYDRIAQVFTNLVGNALKFSKKGKIEITIRETEREVECAVSDTGIGIAQDDLAKVFNKFEQLSQPAVTGEKGSGLGLSICKSIVEMHQGRIRVESRLQHGSTFFFTLPRHTAPELFQQRMTEELTQAAAAGGNVSAIYFEVKPKKSLSPSDAAHLSGWAIDELGETIKTHGGRKTDVLLKDAEGIWLALLNMTAKEAARIVQNILLEYGAFLDKNELTPRIHLSTAHASFPETLQNNKTLIKTLLNELHPHAF